MIIVYLLVLIVSFFLAVVSMKDFELPREIRKLVGLKNKKGSIVFFKNKVKHYRHR